MKWSKIGIFEVKMAKNGKKWAFSRSKWAFSTSKMAKNGETYVNMV